ncbi:hypothetical protein [Caldisphaera sp.]|uniref:TerC family protein n=1 Tax=Caldisphaera sp. TaxID=2060322 RepID=UPI0025C54372|nr:hypothetical protein [Caldisphaera sp.]
MYLIWFSLLAILLFGISIEFLFKKDFKYLILIWVSLSMFFLLLLYLNYGFHSSYLYLASYLLEVSLSLDNILVFLLIFKQFSISFEFQERIVAIGSYSALIFRFFFVFAGIKLIDIFSFGSILLSLIVLFSAYELGKNEIRNENEESRFVLFLKKRFFKDELLNEKFSFFIRKNGKIYPTKYFLVILAIEVTDLIFAFDSIPAIVLLTRNEIIAYSSTIFGTMIIRSIYFNVNKSLINLKHIDGFLAIGLSYIGISSLINSISKFLDINIFIPEYISIIVIIFIIVLALLYSFLLNKKEDKNDEKSFNS